jgi:hypothetical protein
MYHYVRPDSAELPYFRSLHIDDFRRQIDHFAAAYGFVDRSEFLDVVDGRRAPGDGVVLTFDDGVIDHYEHVLPELESRGLWGVFYVPTGMYAQRKLLDVHRIHCLLGRRGGAAMIEAAREIISDDMLSHAHVQEFRQATYASKATRRLPVQSSQLLRFVRISRAAAGRAHGRVLRRAGSLRSILCPARETVADAGPRHADRRPQRQSSGVQQAGRTGAA